MVSLVRTYRRCILDNWSTWRLPYCRIDIWPWYMAERKARSICIAQLHPSVCCGVYGVWTVGDSSWRVGGIAELPYHYKAETCYPPPSMVDNPGSKPLSNARFTRHSHQLRPKVRASTLRSMHHTSIYRRLILQAKNQGATTATTGTALHARLREN